MATGYHGQIDTTRRIMGEKISGKLRSMMGIDEEGESSGNCRQVEVPNLWYIYGQCFMPFLAGESVRIDGLCR